MSLTLIIFSSIGQTIFFQGWPIICSSENFVWEGSSTNMTSINVLMQFRQHSFGLGRCDMFKQWVWISMSEKVSINHGESTSLSFKLFSLLGSLGPVPSAKYDVLHDQLVNWLSYPLLLETSPSNGPMKQLPQVYSWKVVPTTNCVMRERLQQYTLS